MFNGTSCVQLRPLQTQDSVTHNFKTMMMLRSLCMSVKIIYLLQLNKKIQPNSGLYLNAHSRLFDFRSFETPFFKKKLLKENDFLISRLDNLYLKIVIIGEYSVCQLWCISEIFLDATKS
jgi:hypothetical protein